jgi:hypothetical protein
MFGDGENPMYNAGAGRNFMISIVKSVSIGCIVGPCYSSDNESVSYSTTQYWASGVSMTAASPGVMTINNHGLSAGTPVVFWTGTAPSPLALKTIYYVVNPTTNTFELAATPGGTPLNTTTTGSSLTFSGVVNGPNPGGPIVGGWLTGVATCQQAAIGNDLYTMDWGDETTPYLLNTEPMMPSGYTCQHHQGGVALGEGGDGSASLVNGWLEGIIAQGVIPLPAREQLIANNYARLNKIAPPSPTYINFVNGSTPSGWTFTRAACTNGVTVSGNANTCATDALYNNAAGASYNTYATNVPVIDSNGLGMFEKRNNYIPNSDCNYSAACPFPTGTTTLTTGSLSTGKTYKLFCNGTGTITPSSNGGTISSGTSAVQCSSGWEAITMSTAGTITLTASASGSTAVQWADLQDDATGNASTPSPHILTSTTLPATRQNDVMAIGGTVANLIGNGAFSMIVDMTPVILSNYNITTNWGYLIGGSSTGSPQVYFTNSNVYAGVNAADGIYNGTALATGTKYRIGAALAVGNYGLAINGTTYMADGSGTGVLTPWTSGLTYYLGYDLHLLGDCNCWIQDVAFYPNMLTRSQLTNKTNQSYTLP